MMNEIKPKEGSEIKNSEARGYKEIKPESSITTAESEKFWENEIGSGDTDKETQNEGNSGSETETHEPDGNDKSEAEAKEEAKGGGSYKEVKANSDGLTKEVHHIPADSVSLLDRNDGPAIKMDKEDHRQTASFGASAEANEYRKAQEEKIQNDDFRGAMQMDIDDIKEKFGNKYDKEIEQMLQYADKLESEGRI